MKKEEVSLTIKLIRTEWGAKVGIEGHINPMDALNVWPEVNKAIINRVEPTVVKPVLCARLIKDLEALLGKGTSHDMTEMANILMTSFVMGVKGEVFEAASDKEADEKAKEFMEREKSKMAPAEAPAESE